MKTWSLLDAYDYTFGRAISAGCKITGELIDAVLPIAAYYRIARTLIEDAFAPPQFNDPAADLTDAEAEIDAWEPDELPHNNHFADPSPSPNEAVLGDSSPAVSDTTPPSPAGEHPDVVYAYITQCGRCGQRALTHTPHPTDWVCPQCAYNAEAPCTQCATLNFDFNADSPWSVLAKALNKPMPNDDDGPDLNKIRG